MKKIILIVIDGLGDEQIPQLGNKTPLGAAKTPNFNFLAKNGICGLIEPFLFPGQEKPESDISHLALFGFNPKRYYFGRGVYEAAGISFKLKKGDVALRANFATVDENLKVIDRRAGRINKTQPLVKSLNGIEIEKVKFLLKKSFGHRAVLILKCSSPDVEQLSEKISDGDPKKVGLKVKKILTLEKTKEAKFTAKVLNEFLEKAHSILKNHPFNKERIKKGLFPANYILVRGAGKLKKFLNFSKKYKLRACCIAGGTLYKGIGKYLGMELVKVKGANALPNTNLRGKILAIKKNLRNYDFIFCHIKAADNLAEDGNFLGKKEFIERIDKNLKSIIDLKNTLMVITADHSTSSLLKRHCKTSIPTLIYGVGRDSVEKFSEKNCKKGKLGQIKQIDLMKKILKYARRFC